MRCKEKQQHWPIFSKMMQSYEQTHNCTPITALNSTDTQDSSKRHSRNKIQCCTFLPLVTEQGTKPEWEKLVRLLSSAFCMKCWMFLTCSTRPMQSSIYQFLNSSAQSGANGMIQWSWGLTVSIAIRAVNGKYEDKLFGLIWRYVLLAVNGLNEETWNSGLIISNKLFMDRSTPHTTIEVNNSRQTSCHDK